MHFTFNYDQCNLVDHHVGNLHGYLGYYSLWDPLTEVSTGVEYGVRAGLYAKGGTEQLSI